MSLKKRNEINKVLQENGAIYYKVILDDGEEVVYYTPAYTRGYLDTDSRIKAGVI